MLKVCDIEAESHTESHKQFVNAKDLMHRRTTEERRG